MEQLTKGPIQPMRLGPDSRFTFRCHKDVKCFTQCCRGINIILTPYDIIRLKSRLGLSSEQFLSLYTELQMLEKTDVPVVTLKLLDEEGSATERKACPFVRPEGCMVYEDRPTSCRYYPLGVASLAYKDDPDGEEFFFMVREAHCLGFDEDKSWTVLEWREDQGVDVYDRINAQWADLIVRKRSFPPNMHWSEQTKQMFFLASYNIDKFRTFVFESSFLERYPTDSQTLGRIKSDDAALLEFGLKWLKGLLFKQGDPPPMPNKTQE
jgi:Fe-S-cluster containining protein